MSIKWIKLLFAASGIYDALLGAAFLLFGLALFRIAGVTPPNHIGYIQFPALLLILFGIMFLQIAKDPTGRREWIPYGMGLKFAFFEWCSGTNSMAAFQCSGYHGHGRTLPSSFSSLQHGRISASGLLFGKHLGVGGPFGDGTAYSRQISSSRS